MTLIHTARPHAAQQTERTDIAGSLPSFRGGRDEFLEASRSNPRIPELYGESHLSPTSGLHGLSAERRQEINNIINEINQSSLPLQTRKEITNALIRDLTHPEEINQGVHATCVSSSVQTQMLAIERPELYARMIADLAVKGEATFNDPTRSRVQLDQAALSKDIMHVPEPYEERSITERMMQNVLVKYAIGQTVQAGSSAPLTYDHVNDVISGTYQGQSISYGGLFNDQVARLHQGITGMKCAATYPEFDKPGALAAVQNSIDSTGGALVILAWASSGAHQMHAMTVRSIDYENGIVEIYNPHGATNPPPVPGAIQTLSLSDFQNRLSVVFSATTEKNDGVVSIYTPPYEVVYAEASRERGRPYGPEERIPVHITPPTESNVPSETTKSRAPDLTVIELASIPPRRRERDHVAEGAASLDRPKRDMPPAPNKPVFRGPKDDDLLI